MANKRINALLGCFALAAAFVLPGAGCAKDNHYSEYRSFGHSATALPFEEMNAYEGEVMEGSESNQHAVENGMIISPYLTCKVNGKPINVYATRCVLGAHSFGYVDVTEEGDICLSVELELVKTRQSVVVLPLNKNVTAELDGTKKKVTATIRDTGSFSFAFDNKEDRGFTLIVKRAPKPEFPEDYTVKYFEPGTYTAEETEFTEEKTVYYFKEGDYSIDSIVLPSNSILYCDYAYFMARPDSQNAALRSSYTENIKVLGRSIYDFSGIDRTTGGKMTFVLRGVEGFEYSGITSIDSSWWTFQFIMCADGEISNITALGYRSTTDGIMLTNCHDVRVSDSFVRAGDDAFEVKSTESGEGYNITFEDCHAWNDIAVGFGIIYEMNEVVRDVTFRNCSVGFNMPTWDVTRAAATVCMNDYGHGNINKNITFENFEIYYSKAAAISICLHQGSVEDVRFKDFTVHRDLAVYTVYIDFPSAGMPDGREVSIKSMYLDNILSAGNKITFEQIKNAGYAKALWLDGVKYTGN